MPPQRCSESLVSSVRINLGESVRMRDVVVVVFTTVPRTDIVGAHIPPTNLPSCLVMLQAIDKVQPSLTLSSMFLVCHCATASSDMSVTQNLKVRLPGCEA